MNHSLQSPQFGPVVNNINLPDLSMPSTMTPSHRRMDSNTSRSLRVPRSKFCTAPDPTSLLDLDVDLDLSFNFDFDCESPLVPLRGLYATAVTGDFEGSGLTPTPCPRPISKTKSQPYKNKNMREMIGEDDFEALPIAVRRKYFSTLERLRFAENPGSFTIHDLAKSTARRRHSSGADRLRFGPALQSSTSSSDAPNKLQRLSRQSSVSSADVSWLLTLPDKLRKKQIGKEEQTLYTHRHRESVILDAADEAIYKASRRASRNLKPMLSSPTSDKFTIRNSMDSIRTSPVDERPNSISNVLMESFRWMDEEDNLDLRLVLDDYHANLDGVVIPSPAATQRPSFRRNMSISKIPFGRSSISSHKSPSSPRSPVSPPFKSHSRQMSRTLSIMQPRHGLSESVSSIDPHATHYQDPEARLKLRVYLASPQKFDEAIEFGFPSMEGVTDADKENKKPPKTSAEIKFHQSLKSPLAETNNQTFLNDDTMSWSEDDASVLEPDFPLTPSEHDGTFQNQAGLRPEVLQNSRPSEELPNLEVRKPTLHKQQDSYTQALAGSREMTLRMTLTRPDLRADESVLYGWQSQAKSPVEEPILGALEATPTTEKYVQGPFGGVDGWGPVEKDSGVVRRIWNRVKSQRRSP